VEKVAVVIDQIITTVVDSIKQIDLTPDWVDDALAEINQNPLNKFQAQAAINTLISSPTCPLSRFLDNLKSDFKCPIIGSMAARLLL
jgi:hypothetical protein